MLFLARRARRLSRKRPSWGQSFEAVEQVVSWGLEHRALAQIDAIGVDEIQYAKGHKYLTLVWQIDIGVTRVLMGALYWASGESVSIAVTIGTLLSAAASLFSSIVSC
jgi:hypothetical protein